MLEQDVAGLVTDQVDFTDDTVEASLEAVLVPYGGLIRKALEIESAAGTAEDGVSNAVSVASGCLKLANQFGKAFKDLTDDQVQQVQSAVAEIVTGPNEALVEEFFNLALETIRKTQAHNEVIDDLIAAAADNSGN